ncbi:MAG: regulatory protein RecX [Eubacterium sp.]
MKISHSKGRGKKIHLFIDDEYMLTTDIDFWASHFYKDGSEITEEQWQELVDSVNYKKAIDKCYNLLSRRDHSVYELKTKLLRTVDEKNAELALDRMLELGYLDDEKYARRVVDYLLNKRNMSSSFIKQELYKRGIDADIISSAMQEAHIDNVPSVIELIQGKYNNKLSAENGREKVVAALMRKGFSYSDIKEAFYRIENDEIDEQF